MGKLERIRQLEQRVVALEFRVSELQREVDALRPPELVVIPTVWVTTPGAPYVPTHLPEIVYTANSRQ